MSLTVENIISRNKPMCEYTTRHIGTLHLYEMLGDYVVLYRPNLNNVDLIVLTLTGSFPHAAGVYEAVEKQMKEVEKGMDFISQELRNYIAKTSGGYAYRQVADASGYCTASNYNNIIQGMDDVIAPIIEEYLTQE
nr:MAG TPA: hypothetical protein [Caudoviricetes sp.]